MLSCWGKSCHTLDLYVQKNLTAGFLYLLAVEQELLLVMWGGADFINLSVCFHLLLLQKLWTQDGEALERAAGMAFR